MNHYPIHIEDVKKAIPLDAQTETSIIASRREIEKILHGRSEKIIIIVGPCALQSKQSALEYATRLRKLQKEVESSFFLVMRTYYEKARSLNSWKGVLYPKSTTDEEIDYNTPLIETRDTLYSIAQMGIPLAAELIDPIASLFFQDLLSWASIGARTVHSQLHRLFASSLSMPCGIKNPLDGSIAIAGAAIAVASAPQFFLRANLKGSIEWIQSDGNPYAHLILRGSTQSTNYHRDEIEKARVLLTEMGLNQSLIVDCSHGNSQGDFHNQKKVFQEVLEGKISEKNRTVRGLMLESFLQEGTIRDRDLSYISEEERLALFDTVSHVDPCLGWDETQTLIHEAHALLQTSNIC